VLPLLVYQLAGESKMEEHEELELQCENRVKMHLYHHHHRQHQLPDITDGTTNNTQSRLNWTELSTGLT